jgi:MerR family transcriptional regulator, light-induced transcriptional regulator
LDSVQETEQGHAIRVVVRRTGLSAHVIRVWERRYRAVEPVRTATNRRLYTEADIERLRLLHVATKAGHTISHIAALPNERLQELIRLDAPNEPAVPLQGTGDAAKYLSACMLAVERLDPVELEVQLTRAATEFSQQVLLETIVDPLMHQIGNAWQKGSLRIADEHMACAVVRTFLGSLQDLRRAPASGPGIVVTTPSGQVHEVGAMMVAILAAAAGWRAIYLGPDLPADEICGAARRHGASVVALSIVFPTEDPQMPRELRRLRSGLDVGVEIFAGGRASNSYAAPLREIGAHVFTKLGDLGDRLAPYANTTSAEPTG